MQHTSFGSSSGPRRLSALFLTLALAAAAVTSPASSRAAARQTNDGRPRRVQTPAAPQQQATPAPVPRATPPPARPAQPAPQNTTPAAQPTQTPSASPTPEQGQEVSEDEIIRSDVDLINLQVRVIDRNNRPINDVRKEEFRVFEDGVPQVVEFFTKEEVPIQYGLVVDNSGSMRSQLPKVIEAGKIIVNSNRPGDETTIVRFVDSDEIKIWEDFTAKQEDLVDALDTMFTEGGQTAVVDAVFLAAEHVSSYKKGDHLNDRRRRALILVTDGEDRTSFHKQEELFQSLRENDVQIYVIGFVNELDKEGGIIKKSPREKAVKLINRLAQETGGRAFFPNSLSELPQIAQEITRDLRTQYVISYSPTNKRRDGTFRQIKVTVADASGKEKRIALTRSGRTAPSGEAPAPPAPAKTQTSTSMKKP